MTLNEQRAPEQLSESRCWSIYPRSFNLGVYVNLIEYHLGEYARLARLYGMCDQFDRETRKLERVNWVGRRSRQAEREATATCMSYVESLHVANKETVRVCLACDGPPLADSV